MAGAYSSTSIRYVVALTWRTFAQSLRGSVDMTGGRWFLPDFDALRNDRTNVS